MKKSLEDYRPNATGSILDEYERAFFEIKSILQDISENEYKRIVDAKTENLDCRSIETMMNHVVRSGYFYSNYIRESLLIETKPVEEFKILHAEIGDEIDKMFAYTLEIFDGRWKEMDEQLGKVFINARWGITYNIDQMLEHAIVHALRHRRMIEKYLLINDK